MQLLVFISFILGLLQPSTVRLHLDWFPNVEFTGMYVAKEKGWYKEKGIDVEFIFDDMNIVESVLSGKTEIGMHSGNELIKWVSSGTDIKAFAAQYQISPACILVAQDSDIRSPKDLKGKKVGVFIPQDKGIYKVMLGSVGLDISDVEVRQINTFKEKEIIELMKQKYVDAIIGWEFNWSILFSLLGYNVRVFPGYKYGFHFYGIVFFAKDEYIENNRKTLKDFIDVTFRGWREVDKNPQQWADWMVDNHYPKDRYIDNSRDLTLKHQRLELKMRQRYFYYGIGKQNMGIMSKRLWSNSLKISKKYGLVDENSKIVPENLYDMSVINFKNIKEATHAAN